MKDGELGFRGGGGGVGGVGCGGGGGRLDHQLPEPG